MKMLNRVIQTSLLVGALFVSTAQAQPGPRHAGPPSLNAGDDALPPRIQWFFDNLKETDPQEYDRLLNLRDNDPEAYRRALRERLRDARERRGMRDGNATPGAGPRHPGRQDGADWSRQGRHGQGDMRMDDRRPPNPEIEKAEAAVRELARKLRNAESAEEQARLRDELKVAIGKGFDLHQQARKERLEEMEKRVEHIKSILDERTAKRDEIIQARLDEITAKGPKSE